MFGYEEIKQMKTDLRREGYKYSVKDLVALVIEDDPFYAGVPASIEQAKWFVNVWERFGSKIGSHLKGLHYKLVNDVKNPTRHTGHPYQNVQDDWNYLARAGRYARYLGMIPEGAIIDKRNPEPHIYTFDPELSEPGWHSTQEEGNFNLPSISTGLTYSLHLYLPTLSAHGYTYYSSMQRYHLEIWIEKTSMDDLLKPLCEKYNINLITGAGEMSIPSVIKMLKRIYTRKKPSRIFYISDFDPAGQDMPISVARKIEYYLYNSSLWTEEELSMDVKLDPIILTKMQVDKYNLPRIPIKKKEKKRKRFEKQHGRGGAELDALEAIYPGEFEKIIEKRILEFRDPTLKERIEEVWRLAQGKVNKIRKKEIDPFEPKFDEIKMEAEKICERYEMELENLSDSLDAELEPLSERLENIERAIAKKINSINIELPGLPEGEIEEKTDSWLYDSARDYLEQLRIYKKAKGK